MSGAYEVFSKHVLAMLVLILLINGFSEDIPNFLRMKFSYIDPEIIDTRFPDLPDKEITESLSILEGEDKNKNGIRDDVERIFTVVFYKDNTYKNRYGFDAAYASRVEKFLKNSYKFSKIEKTYKEQDLSNEEKRMMRIFLIERQKLKNEATCIYDDYLENDKYLRENFNRIMKVMLNTEERRDHYGRYLFFRESHFIKLFADYNDPEFYGFYKFNDTLKEIRKKECEHAR